MQFKPPLCGQVSGQEPSQRKTHTREFVFSKLFLKLPKMAPVQLHMMMNMVATVERQLKQAQPSKKVLTPPIIILVKTLHHSEGIWHVSPVSALIHTWNQLEVVNAQTKPS